MKIIITLIALLLVTTTAHSQTMCVINCNSQEIQCKQNCRGPDVTACVVSCAYFASSCRAACPRGDARQVRQRLGTSYVRGMHGTHNGRELALAPKWLQEADWNVQQTR
jgi:hypothetical protein